jgi:hypothetical protein
VAERLGLGIIPGVGWRASEIRAVAIEAEQAGFDAILTAEVNNDALALGPDAPSDEAARRRMFAED